MPRKSTGKGTNKKPDEPLGRPDLGALDLPRHWLAKLTAPRSKGGEGMDLLDARALARALLLFHLSPCALYGAKDCPIEELPCDCEIARMGISCDCTRKVIDCPHEAAIMALSPAAIAFLMIHHCGFVLTRTKADEYLRKLEPVVYADPPLAPRGEDRTTPEKSIAVAEMRAGMLVYTDPPMYAREHPEDVTTKTAGAQDLSQDAQLGKGRGEIVDSEEAEKKRRAEAKKVNWPLLVPGSRRGAPGPTPKVFWEVVIDGLTATVVSAVTKSEARAEGKRALGIPDKGRLPVGTVVRRMAAAEGGEEE
jgi:hypothetical protein